MSFWDKLPFIGRKKESTLGADQVAYIGAGKGFDKTYVSQLNHRLERELVGEDEDTKIRTRIWNGTHGLKVSPEEGRPYRIKLLENGKVRLEIAEDHPDRDKVIQILETFFECELGREKM